MHGRIGTDALDDVATRPVSLGERFPLARGCSRATRSNTTLRPARSSCSASRLGGAHPTARCRSTGSSTASHTSGNVRSADINQSKLPTAHESSVAIAFAIVDFPAPVQPLTTTSRVMVVWMPHRARVSRGAQRGRAQQSGAGPRERRSASASSSSARARSSNCSTCQRSSCRSAASIRRMTSARSSSDATTTIRSRAGFVFVSIRLLCGQRHGPSWSQCPHNATVTSPPGARGSVSGVSSSSTSSRSRFAPGNDGVVPTASRAPFALGVGRDARSGCAGERCTNGHPRRVERRLPVAILALELAHTGSRARRSDQVIEPYQAFACAPPSISGDDCVKTLLPLVVTPEPPREEVDHAGVRLAATVLPAAAT